MGEVNNSGTKRNGRFVGKGGEITVGIRVMGDLWDREIPVRIRVWEILSVLL